MKRSVAFLALCAGLVAGASGHAREIEGFDANASAPARGLRPELAREAARVSGVAASIDERRGVPSFLWANGAQPAPPGVAARPDAAARQHLARFARAYGLTPAALATAEVAHVHDLGRGAVVVTLRQRLDGVEVYRNDAKVVMRQDLSLVAITGNLHPDGTPQARPGARAFTIQPAAALSAAVQDLYGIPAPAGTLTDLKRDEGGYLRFGLEPVGALHGAGIGFTEPARVKKVFFPVGERLVPAYFVEVYAGKLSDVESDYVRYVIAAKDGQVLFRQNLTAYDAFNYRVWSEPTGTMRPLDGPISDYTPHPTGTPDGTDPAFIAPELVSMEGFNTNPGGGIDPWLPASAVQTLGNNVDAYADHNAPDGYSNGDLRATTTAPLTFDRVYDVNLEPVSSTDQIMAATTQLFFVNNWLHDYFYDSGFDEAGANAQANNYGRGGLGGDVLRAEAQDGAFVGNRNNANMSTPADGVSPRMQMYLWASNDVVRALDVQPLGLSLATGTAGFGPNTFNTTGELILINDTASPSPTDGCENTAWASDVTGKIALIDRGTCSFKTKVLNAQQRGAIGVIIANNQAGNTPNTLGNDATITTPITIPTFSIGNADGATLKAAMQGGQTLTLSMQREPGIERDGTIDNAIVAHEWGHYFHHRLSDCGTPTCRALSEGWADFLAQHMVIREGDDLDGTFALAIYSTKVFGDSGYFGIRRSPYTTDFTKNALTFQHIQN
ncbi:MAG TPA: M36 family metallopeptidase, partial [Candidatus Nanopelagicales bacterium]|nr:M36 family metallopeptidase [Candidatus Nanopelagicales bacterium]